MLILRLDNSQENTSNLTNCKNDGVAKVVTSALRNARAAAVIRLYSGRLNGL